MKLKYECDPPNIPADLYYACINGSYDYNGNGVYGEPADGPGGGEVDLLAEVYVGRAPVDSCEEVTNFVRKTIAYEKSSGDPYLSEVWMVGQEMGLAGAANWGGNWKDEIKDGSCEHGYCTAGFPDCFDNSTLYDRDREPDQWPKSVLMNIINGNIHTINHLGHADTLGVMRMDRSDVGALTNSKYFFGYSQGCYAGAFDNRDAAPPHGNCEYLDSDCILEHFVTEASGAFGFIHDFRRFEFHSQPK